ncbi:MAG: hypothetical protein DHS20C18_33700 [Saprospiraceae bacterium]|nr:MAG: hypothetical protein DHS20C18_33700 [Saprospiraceae bacterium]
MKSSFCLGTLLLFVLLLNAQGNILEQLIEKNQDQLGVWADHPETYEVQIIYTQIDRDEKNRPQFSSHTYGVNANRYFYPASTVKMPTAFMALEKLNQLNIKGLDKYTPMKTGAVTPPQSPVVTDSTAENLLPSIAHYIRKIFLVSNNDAYNRLYEFLGQRYLNQGLRDKGYTDLRLIHRLSAPGFDSEANRHSNPVSFYDFDTLHYYQGEVYSMAPQGLDLEDEVRGKAYMNHEGKIISKPFDFTQKNFVSLQNLHDILKAVLFPEVVPEHQRFQLTEDDYRFLYDSMSKLPKESRFPKSEESDNYVKFWMYGDSSPTDIPDQIRIFNKVGWAYGYLTDVAYIIDVEQNIEFMLAGVIHVNANQTYNDGQYEYHEIGLPFFKQLGQVIYEHELQRERKFKPDLRRFSSKKRE